MVVISSDLPDSGLQSVAVCIVGSGAAGLTLACELDGAGFKVLLLEAGDFGLDAGRSNEYYRGDAAVPHPSPSDFRRIMFGGTTSIWGGRCVPFDPIDFERRDYIPESGWPISYEEVARYYPRALTYCDAGEFDFSVGQSLPGRRALFPGLPASGVLLGDRIERYSLPTDFGKRYRQKIKDSVNVTAVLNARCVSLKKASGEDRVESIEFVDATQRRRCVRAQAFVLATGGIEATRLLMASAPESGGLGNSHDYLGRYYSCHFENVIGKVVPSAKGTPFNFERTRDGVYCRRKLQFAAEAQRGHRLLNMAFRLHFPEYSNAGHGSAVMSAIYLVKNALLPEYQMILQHSSQEPVKSPAVEHLRNVVMDMPRLFMFAWEWLVSHTLSQRKLPYTLVPNADGSFPLEFNSEQTPLPSSRITLSNELDRDGLRRVNVDWRLCGDDVEAAKRAYQLLREVLNAAGSCRLEFDEATLDDSLRRSVPLGGHHIGTTRMAASAQAGVVNRNCAVFEAPNLFLASSSVFPTSGHANPTLTIVAMALRLAEHLKTRVAGQGALDTFS